MAMKPTLRPTATGVLVMACLVLLVEATTLMRSRWVEDESWLANGSWTLLQEGRLRMPIFPAAANVVVDVYPPLHQLAMVPAFAAFGLGEVQARSVSALAAIATLVVVFVVARRLAGPTGAAVAAVLLATDTFLVVSARTARPEALATLLCWLAVWMALTAEEKRSSRWALSSGVAAGLSILTHPLGIAFVGAIGLFHLYGLTTVAADRRSPPRRRVLTMFALGVAIALAPSWSGVSRTRRTRRPVSGRRGSPRLRNRSWTASSASATAERTSRGSAASASRCLAIFPFVFTSSRPSSPRSSPWPHPAEAGFGARVAVGRQCGLVPAPPQCGQQAISAAPRSGPPDAAFSRVSG